MSIDIFSSRLVQNCSFIYYSVSGTHCNRSLKMAILLFSLILKTLTFRRKNFVDFWAKLLIYSLFIRINKLTDLSLLWYYLFICKILFLISKWSRWGPVSSWPWLSHHFPFLLNHWLLGYLELQVKRNPDLLQHTDFKKLFSDEMSQSRQLEICKLPFLELITITFAIQ